MYKEQATIEATKKPETQENHEVPQSVESPEDLRQQMMSESEKETNHFKGECADDIVQTEARAEKDGLAVDGEDKKALGDLGAEAEAAKKELEAEIGDKNESKEKVPTKEQQDAFESGKEKVLSLQAEGNDKSPEYWALYSHLTEGLGKDIQWRNAGDINAEKVNKMLASKFPEKDQIVTRTCPKCGKEYTGTNASYCACGADLELKKSEIDSGMDERVIKRPELLNQKEASKKLLSEERKKLAEEIRAQRKLQHNRLSEVKVGAENTSESAENEDNQYAQLAEMQSAEASSLAERISSSDLSDEDANDERENIKQLISNSEDIGLLKKRLAEHYAKADEIAKEKFESMQKSVEQTALRNGVFFVHTIQEREFLRHNELSNIGNEATYEDDADILLSLEPTISASSIFSGKSEDGKVSGLWSNTGGFLIGGGDIRYGDRNDLDSKSEGIKKRTIADGFEKQSVADIDKVVSKRGEAELIYKTYDGVKKQESGSAYNEFIIDNPKIFGYYQPVGIEEDELLADGKLWAGDMSTRDEYEELANIKKKFDKIQQDPTFIDSGIIRTTPELYQEKLSNFQQKIDKYKERFQQMADRGNPLYIMTPDRKVYEYLGINDDGSVNTGEQLTPEEVATGRAGLAPEKRRELGEKIIEKRVFKQQETVEEAREIIGKL